MACIYRYNGKTFQTEDELNDYLSSKMPFFPKYGDAVFSTILPANVFDSLVRMGRNGYSIFERKNNLVRKRKMIEIEDDPYNASDYEYAVSFVGITTAIPRMFGITGDRLVPEYSMKMYLARMRTDLASGNFDIIKNEDDMKIIFGVDENGMPNQPEPIPISEFDERVASKLEAKWKFQADAGNYIHDIMQAYFVGLGKDETGKTTPIRLIKDSSLRKKELIRIIRGDGGKYSTFYTNAYFDNTNNKVLDAQPVDVIPESVIPDNMVDDLYNIAERIYNEIKATKGGLDENGNENFEIFAEFPVYDDMEVEMNEYGTDETKKGRLSGSIDLMVVGKDGIPDIIDYKTSTKQYSQFIGAKKRTYGYQLNFYRRMLNRAGLDTESSRMFIAPIQINGISMNDDGSFKLTGIVYDKNDTGLKPLDTHDATGSMMNNIDNILPPKVAESSNSETLFEDVKNEQKAILPEYAYSYENLTDEYIHKQFKIYCAVDKTSGKLKYYKNPEHKGTGRMLNGREIQVDASNPSAMYEKIREYHLSKPARRKELVYNIYDSVVSEINDGNTSVSMRIPNDNMEYVNRILYPYRNGNWEVVTGDKRLLDFGIILFRNKVSGRIDVINISNESLNDLHSMKKGTELLSGHIHDDIVEISKNSRMLKAVEGNIELIRTMTVLNNLTGFFDPNKSFIGNIVVLNPYDAEAIYACNEDIKYTYNTLVNASRNESIKKNNSIRLGDDFEMIEGTMIDIQSRIDRDVAEYMSLNDKDKKKRGRTNLMKEFNGVRVYDGTGNNGLNMFVSQKNRTRGEQIQQLITLQRRLESLFPFLKEIDSKSTIDSSNRDIYDMYVEIARAIQTLSGIQNKQQLFESSKYMQFAGLKSLFTKGYTGTMLDNPGVLYSNLLNSTTSYVNTAYQNIRDIMIAPIAKFVELEERMIKATKNNMVTMMVKNREHLWDEFYRKDADGTINKDLLFVRPEEVQDPEKRQILKELLIEINRARHYSGGRFATDEQIASLSDNESYYYMPIVKKGRVDENGVAHNISETIGSKIKNALPHIFSIDKWKEAFGSMRDKVSEAFGVTPEVEARSERSANDLYEMNNTLLGEEDIEDRRKKIDDIGFDNISTNAINSGISMAYSTISDAELSNALAVIKSSIVGLKSNGEIMNRSYAGDIEYLENYIRKNVKNEDINPEELKPLVNAVDKLSNIAVSSVLMFSPVQMIYQPLQGFFVNSSMVAKRILGNKSFELKDLEEGFRIAYQDILSSGKTKVSLINQVFGINDMDMNDYAAEANNHKDIASISGLRKIGMMFASRPDYYNRMSIFIAQMIKDGTWDAYEQDGYKLKYDFKKDKRFSKLNDPNAVHDDEYMKQLGEYNAMARQLTIEGARNEDGSLFQYQYGKIVSLPKAYTAQQSESYKNIADDAYGYYTHEKKAMIHAMFAGKLFMQFKTYFSGKKNQYFLPGGVKMRGSYEHYKDDTGHGMYSYVSDDGIESYCYLEDNGKYINRNTGEEISPDKVTPFYYWKGRYQEGVVMTLAKIISEASNKKSFKEALKYYTENPDESIRDAYITNRNILLSDLLIALLIGGIIASLLSAKYKDILKDDDIPRIAKDAIGIFSVAVANATMDANIINTVKSVFGNWTPMTISWSIKTAGNIVSTLSGDKSAWDSLCSSVSSIRQVKNTVSKLWDEVEE